MAFFYGICLATLKKTRSDKEIPGRDLEGLVKLCMSKKEDLKFIRLANYLQDLYIVLSKLPPLEEITLKTLILLSQRGSISDFEANQEFIEMFPNQETIVIDADHWMLTEKPTETREAIENWLQGSIKIWPTAF
ncbi:MAG: alpha/beta fold hydrolase [Bacteriovoracaceae bacterium]